MKIQLRTTRIIIFIFFAFLVSLEAGAQNISPIESTIIHNDKIRPCLSVNLDPEPKSLKNAWIDFLKDEYDFKLKGMGWFSNKDLLNTEEVLITKLSTKKMDFYTNVIEDENGSEMKVFASFGYDIYIDEEHYPKEFMAMEEMLNSFLKEHLPKYYNKAIDETEERIKDFNVEINDLKNEITDETEDKEKLNRKIEKANRSIDDKNQKIKVAETKLKGRQEKLERVKVALNQL
jgi:hypothetical protein